MLTAFFGKLGGPEFFAGLLVEGAEQEVGSCADKDEAATSDDGATGVGGSGLGDTLGGEFLVLAERDAPSTSAVLASMAMSSPQGAALQG